MFTKGSDNESNGNENDIGTIIKEVQRHSGNAAGSSVHNNNEPMLRKLDEWKRIAQIKKDPKNCKMYMKTGACQFGSRCSQLHVTTGSKETILIHNFFQDRRLENKNISETEEVAIIQEFEQFYDRLIGEFRAVGTVNMFKCCKNFASHLRGNVYVQYSNNKEAMAALRVFNGRYYGGRTLSVDLCHIASWKAAICGLFDKRLCPRNNICGCLHVFRNPRNDFSVQDRTDFDPEHALRFQIYDSSTINPHHPVFLYYKLRDTYNSKDAYQNLLNITSDMKASGSEAKQANTNETLNTVADGALECKFFMKAGACRFGSLCTRGHIKSTNSCTVLIQNFFKDERLSKPNEGGKEYDEVELIKVYEAFYDKFVSEFRSFGTVVMFKCCQNCVPHLRGNVFVQYSSQEEAQKAVRGFDGREYQGKVLHAVLSHVSNWKAAICGLFDKRLCPRGKVCNFLHVFRNPRNAYSVLNRTDFDPERASKQGTYDQTLVNVNHPVFVYYRHRDAIGYRSGEKVSISSDKDSPGFKSRLDEFDDDQSSCSESPDIKEADAPVVQTKQTKSKAPVCKFFIKTGACKYGDICINLHEAGETDLMVIPNYFKDDVLESGVEITGAEEIKMIKRYEKFYEKVIKDFKAVGEVVNFKCCLNANEHLRGNAYVQYSSPEEATKVVECFEKARLCPQSVAVWASSICSLFDRRECPRGQTCNFLHVFRNPENEFFISRNIFIPKHHTKAADHPVLKYYRERDEKTTDKNRHISGYRPRSLTPSRNKRSGRSRSNTRHRQKSRSKSPRKRTNSRSKSPQHTRGRTDSKCNVEIHERKFVQSFHSPSPVRDRYILNRRSSSRDLPSHSHSLEKDQLESYSITIRNDRQLTPSPSPTAYRYGDGREEIRATEQVLRAGYRDIPDGDYERSSPRLEFLAHDSEYISDVGVDRKRYLPDDYNTVQLRSSNFHEKTYWTSYSDEQSDRLLNSSRDDYRSPNTYSDLPLESNRDTRSDSLREEDDYLLRSQQDRFLNSNRDSYRSSNIDKSSDRYRNRAGSPRSQFLVSDSRREEYLDYSRQNSAQRESQQGSYHDESSERTQRRSRSPARRSRSRSPMHSRHYIDSRSRSYRHDRHDTARFRK